MVYRGGGLIAAAGLAWRSRGEEVARSAGEQAGADRRDRVESTAAGERGAGSAGLRPSYSRRRARQWRLRDDDGDEDFMTLSPSVIEFFFLSTSKG